ncbi:MAG: transglycosylase SLT domain-containing protein [Rhodocyclaceae bacterium]|nr:transglycosylase SLT domain-containing protein [Rhodocyclaceae bacterium]MBK6553151.1 transglycosylase SLT domain-containing protein [Rhodocyclaceae bacterium]MBK9311830.1 transglycosylase SLT domain-containing protein [Rhodocyclaceae bacterium]
MAGSLLTEDRWRPIQPDRIVAMSFRFPLLVALAILTGLALPARASVVEPGDARTVAEVTQQVSGSPPPTPTIDLTADPDNLWQRIRNGFGMPDLDSPLVADRQAWYLNRPDLLQRTLARGRKYLHHIVDELERRGMPTELALLPMVESSFNPLAASPARALGMWQFIPSTGKNYALEQNWWRDERRDVVASTSAALDYLHNVYERHGDWHLALASYNWGEGAVGRAIAKNQALGLPTDYASLSMPGETRYYVPKLQALKNIVAQPELFGFRLDDLPNRPYFGTVALPGDMDVTLAAKLAEMPVEEFIALNPAYHRPLIKGDQDTQLVVPADKVETFLGNLARHEAQARPLANWRTHVLARGEKFERIAARYGLDLAYLKQLNGIGVKARPRPGLNLLVPGPGAQLPEQLAAHLPKLPAAEPAKAKPAKAKPGKKGKSVKSAKPAKAAAAVKGKSKAKSAPTTRKPAKGKQR